MAAGAAGWLLVNSDFSEPTEPTVEAPLALERVEVEPQPIAAAPIAIEAPPAAEEVIEPVQPIEERGDAMLFEIDALGGTPFDQAITMPFD